MKISTNNCGNLQANGNGNPPSGITPGDRKACNSITAALLQSVRKIGTQGAMKGLGKHVA
jgi:hypothetical protein